jgi:catechol 2,3-dioxygenase-like lactoylglutathione lyase family enzyme
VADTASLHHTGLTVADLDRSLEFYRDLLGFEVVLEQEKEGGYLGAIVGRPDAHVRMAHVKLPGGDHRLELFQYLRPQGRRPSEQLEPWQIGPTHICLIVDDLSALHERLRAAGIDSFLSPPVDVDTGANAGGKALYLRDPDGALVELFQPPSRPQ